MTDFKLLRKIVKVARENPQFKKALMPIIKEAMEFDTQDAMDKYLKEHPDADKKNHSVKKQDGPAKYDWWHNHTNTAPKHKLWVRDFADAGKKEGITFEPKGPSWGVNALSAVTAKYKGHVFELYPNGRHLGLRYDQGGGNTKTISLDKGNKTPEQIMKHLKLIMLHKDQMPSNVDGQAVVDPTKHFKP